MSNLLISIFMAAGAGAFMYSKVGKRLGYGQTQSVWLVVGIGAAFVFLFFITFLTFVVHLH